MNKTDINLNLNDIVDGKPVGWSFNAQPGYSLSLDDKVVKSGKHSICMESTEESGDLQTVALELPYNYDGQQITLAGYIKTENVTGGFAGLWMRINPAIAFDKMDGRGLQGTNDWTKCEITLNTKPTETSDIYIGAFFDGKGKIWIDDLSITIDGQDISEVKIYVPETKPVIPIENMKFIELARRRKSIRKFTDQEVSTEQINLLLEVARMAPSAGNLQPWHFYVIKDKEIGKKLCEAAYGQPYMSQAPVTIVVCAVPKRSSKKYDDRGKYLYCIQDTAAAIEHILLAATEMGLGSLWIGAFNEDAVSEALNLSDGLKPVAIIPIGYTHSNPENRGRLSINEITTFIGFD
ncbi:MAG: nitroreductase family protein [Candidatus Cloacimonetes bacterium]|nr:nitroreductase family protein [Candidatus Cloacimonadota bacterium]